MRNERKILKQNSLTSGIIIKFGLRVAGVALCTWFIYQVGMSAISVVGVYLIARCVLKVIKLSIRLIFTFIYVLLLVVAIAILTTIIF